MTAEEYSDEIVRLHHGLETWQVMQGIGSALSIIIVNRYQVQDRQRIAYLFSETVSKAISAVEHSDA